MDVIPKDDLVNQLVAAINARDVDRIDELTAEAVDAPFLPDGVSPGSRFLEFFVRSPWTVVSRAEVGHDPVAAVWSAGVEEALALAGYLEVEVADEMITDLRYVEEIPEDFLAEDADPAWVSRQTFEEVDADDFAAGT